MTHYSFGNSSSLQLWERFEPPELSPPIHFGYATDCCSEKFTCVKSGTRETPPVCIEGKIIYSNKLPERRQCLKVSKAYRNTTYRISSATDTVKAITSRQFKDIEQKINSEKQHLEDLRFK